MCLQSYKLDSDATPEDRAEQLSDEDVGHETTEVNISDLDIDDESDDKTETGEHMDPMPGDDEDDKDGCLAIFLLVVLIIIAMMAFGPTRFF